MEEKKYSRCLIGMFLETRAQMAIDDIMNNDLCEISKKNLKKLDKREDRLKKHVLSCKKCEGLRTDYYNATRQYANTVLEAFNTGKTVIRTLEK